MRRSDRVAVAGLAEDMAAGVGEDRIVADQDDRGVGREQVDDAPGQGSGQAD
jgi:hypothetical protein